MIRTFRILAILALHVAPLRGATLLDERFASDPLAAGRATITSGDAARFDFASDRLVASYDTSLPTTKLAWNLAAPLDATTDFQLTVDANISGSGFFADPNRFAQLAFGLINSVSTGDDRAGGDGGDAFDVVSIDYFPNVSPIFGGPSLGPTVIGSDAGGGFFNSIQFPFNLEGGLDDEAPLPLDTVLTFVLDYQAQSSLLTLRVLANGAALPLNANQADVDPGGFDGDRTTIQLPLNPGTPFSVDQFAILLWEDTFLAAGAEASLRADVEFSRILVTTPENAIPGDTNDDGRVDLTDLNNVRNHFGESSAESPGDAAPRDGIVDLNDLNRVRNHFGNIATSVPEPGTAGLLTLIGGALLAVGGRNARRS